MRLAVLLLFALLIALPSLLGGSYTEPAAPPATFNSSTSATIPGHADAWLDFMRTVVGAFVGAAAAFLSNRKLQQQARRREEIAAGNSALATVVRQYNGFLNVQRVVREEIARRNSISPETPLWFIFRPIVHFLDDELKFDFNSLSYIFEDGSIEAFQQLHAVESLHRSLHGYVRRFNKAAELKQERIESAGVLENNFVIEVGAARRIVGPRLIAELEGMLGAIEEHCSQDAEAYLSAASELRRALSRRFGAGVRLIQLVGPR